MRLIQSDLALGSFGLMLRNILVDVTFVYEIRCLRLLG
jgi:hypothetical protein